MSLQEILGEAVELTCAVCSEVQGKIGSIYLFNRYPGRSQQSTGDRDLLEVAFRNLIENALKFSGPDGKIEVRASEDDHNILVEINDNGRGILPDDLHHIFR